MRYFLRNAPGKISKAYNICLTRDVFEEARYYKKDGTKIDIDIKDVVIIENVDLESLRKVQREVKEARLGIDPGESTSISSVKNYINIDVD